jgi:ABC-type Mn2+/Zn2+ transport system permease subunit
VDTDRQSWNAVLKLAVLISVVAAFAAIAISAAGDIPQTAIVLPVIIVAFTASWVQTGRARRQELPVRIAARHHRAAPTA